MLKLNGRSKHRWDQRFVRLTKLEWNGLGWMASMLASSDVSSAAPMVHKPITERAFAAYKLGRHHLWSVYQVALFLANHSLWLPIIDKHIIREREQPCQHSLLNFCTHSIGCWVFGNQPSKMSGNPGNLPRYLLALTFIEMAKNVAFRSFE